MASSEDTPVPSETDTLAGASTAAVLDSFTTRHTPHFGKETGLKILSGSNDRMKQLAMVQSSHDEHPASQSSRGTSPTAGTMGRPNVTQPRPGDCDSLADRAFANGSNSGVATPSEPRDATLSRPDSPTVAAQVSSASLSSSSSNATLASEPPIAGPSRLPQQSLPASFPIHTEYVNPSHVPKRQRIPRACDSCRRKKIRCNLSTSLTDDAAQICANCHQSGLPCTFTKSPAKRGPNKGYIQQLEHRLAALESTVSNDPGADAAPTSSADTSADRIYGSRRQSPDVQQGQYTLPPQKKPRFSEPLIQQHYPYHHPSGMLPPTHPLSARTPTDEIWTRTAPPSHLTSNSFFLSSNPSSYHQYNGQDSYRRSPYQSPSLPAVDTHDHPQHKSSLPPISHLMSTLPPPTSGSWTPRESPGLQPREFQFESSRTSQQQPYDSQYRQRSVSNAELSAAGSISRGDAFPSFAARGRPHSLSTSTASTQQSEHTIHSAPLLNQYKSTSSRTSSVSPAFSSYEALADGALGAKTILGSRDEQDSPRLSHDTRIFSTTSSRNAGQARRSPNVRTMPLLANLDSSAVCSLDSTALRAALFRTPALSTFAILPSLKLEQGFGDCDYLIKAAYLLSMSSSHLAYTSNGDEDQQWQTDCSAVIGQCMVPTLFERQGNDTTCREIETLMICYVDALRRGRLIAGILGAISGKLAILETMGLPCKRYQAVGILLAVWHTVGYSSRRMYFGTPATSGPEALFAALETDDPTLQAICMFTFSMDRMCRRYCQNGETYVAPESVELTRTSAMNEPADRLPQAQLRLLSILDSFLLTLNFAYNQSPGILPTLEALERQRHHLYAIVNEADSSELLRLLVGPHVLAMATCITLYCLAACKEMAEAEQDADKNMNVKTLERDYLSILDALKRLTTLLSAPPEASLLNSHTFADAGDMRLLYGAICRYVKKNLSSMLLSPQGQMSAHAIIGSLLSVGYLGTILASDSAQ